MKKVYCDICNREVKTEKRSSEYVTPKLPFWMKTVISAVVENDPKYGGTKPDTFDMCIDCARETRNFVKALQQAYILRKYVRVEEPDEYGIIKLAVEVYLTDWACEHSETLPKNLKFNFTKEVKEILKMAKDAEKLAKDVEKLK